MCWQRQGESILELDRMIHAYRYPFLQVLLVWLHRRTLDPSRSFCEAPRTRHVHFAAVDAVCVALGNHQEVVVSQEVRQGSSWTTPRLLSTSELRGIDILPFALSVAVLLQIHSRDASLVHGWIGRSLSWLDQPVISSRPPNPDVSEASERGDGEPQAEGYNV